MPHRGRLNFLTTMLDLPAKYLFMKVIGRSHIPEGYQASDDVISHVGEEKNTTQVKKKEREKRTRKGKSFFFLKFFWWGAEAGDRKGFL